MRTCGFGAFASCFSSLSFINYTNKHFGISGIWGVLRGNLVLVTWLASDFFGDGGGRDCSCGRADNFVAPTFRRHRVSFIPRRGNGLVKRVGFGEGW